MGFYRVWVATESRQRNFLGGQELQPHRSDVELDSGALFQNKYIYGEYQTNLTHTSVIFKDRRRQMVPNDENLAQTIYLIMVRPPGFTSGICLNLF
jgi:hypothetical protein